MAIDLTRNPTPSQQSSGPASLSTITLDKHRSSISLEKVPGEFGEIKVNLNWNQKAAASGFSFFGLKKTTGIDLDVGCLYEMKGGHKGAVQALGEAFGSYDSVPYIQLLGDDRSGSSQDGEWLRINGKYWKDIRRVLVYAFIYQGAPNWKATDGVVTLHVPGQPPIEVHLSNEGSEEGSNQGMCAVALIENHDGAIKVSREVGFFRGHRQMDEAYHWGMRWSAGSK